MLFFYGLLRGNSSSCDPLGENFVRLAVSLTVQPPRHQIRTKILEIALWVSFPSKLTKTRPCGRKFCPFCRTSDRLAATAPKLNGNT